MTAEMAAGRHSRVPANLAQLVVLAAADRVGGIGRWNPKSDQAGADGLHTVDRPEQTRSRPQDDQVQRRPENDDLSAHGPERGGEVVVRRNGRGQEHHAFDGVFIQQFEGLDRDSRATRFGDHEDRASGGRP